MTDFKKLTYGFNALKFVVLDANIAAAQNTRVMLGGLGVNQIELARKPEELLELLVKTHFDIVILEWMMKPVNGEELTRQIRYHPSLKNPTIPILMLSGDGSEAVASTAKNSGVNELAVRPLSPQNLAQHIHKIIVEPKSFIISPHYRGPDRRLLTLDSHADEKRIQLLPPTITHQELALYSEDQGTRILMPDFSLRIKVNLAAVENGLMSTEEIEKEFLEQSSVDVARILELLTQIEKAVGSRAPLERICSSTALVQARAAAFDYELCARVAGYLSDFCRHYFNVHEPAHRLVFEKHVDVMRVIINQNVKGDGGKRGAELASELSKLVFKFV